MALIPSEPIDPSYRSSTITEVSLWGDQLKNGMIVVIQNPALRPEESKNAFWCEIENLRINEAHVKFIAKYRDKTKVVKIVSKNEAWIVKTTSIPPTPRPSFLDLWSSSFANTEPTESTERLTFKVEVTVLPSRKEEVARRLQEVLTEECPNYDAYVRAPRYLD